MQVAKTILAQLGGNRFASMVGAKNFLGGENFLQFDVPARMCANKANKVRVTLDPSDTYTVEFMSLRALKIRVISKHSDIYCDQLQELFTEQTHLLTRF